MGGQTSAPYQLELLGIDMQGRTSATPYTIARAGVGFGTPLIARMGTKGVAAWLTGVGAGNSAVATVGLAVLSLNPP